MANRKIEFTNGEHYHVYNRGTDKRDIVLDKKDIHKFLQSLVEFNTKDPIGSIYEEGFKKAGALGTPTSKLVNIVSFNLLDNHYHLLLEQLQENGISKFMQRFGGGFTKYFNKRHERTGVLFQGAFKAVHIHSDEQLVRLSAYINLNHILHSLGSRSSKWGMRSSWEQYIGERKPKDAKVPCAPGIILSQYGNAGTYKRDALSTIKEIAQEREVELDPTQLIYLEVGVPSGK